MSSDSKEEFKASGDVGYKTEVVVGVSGMVGGRNAGELGCAGAVAIDDTEVYEGCADEGCGCE